MDLYMDNHLSIFLIVVLTLELPSLLHVQAYYDNENEGYYSQPYKRRLSDADYQPPSDYLYLQNVLTDFRDRYDGSPRHLGSIDLGLGGRTHSGSAIARSRSGQYSAQSAFAPGRKRRVVIYPTGILA